MNEYLLDTSAISLLDPARSDLPEAFSAWLTTQSSSLNLSVVTVAEVERGIQKLLREQKHRKAVHLRTWFDAILSSYAGRILPFDFEASQIAGKIDDGAIARGHDPGFADVVIAAIALRHRMTLVTRNVRHFAHLGVTLVDPVRL